MATQPVVDRSGKKVSDRELPADLFEAPVNVSLMHQVVVAGAAAQRAGTHSTKTRAEVSGGGRKPWRQKGTGRARHGSNRSPIWTGGGVAHGPKPRDHSMRVNKKMKRSALRGALTDALGSGKLALVDDLGLEEPRTREAQALLSALGLQGKVLVVLPAPGDEVAERSFRNLPYVKLSYARSLSVYDLLAADRVLFTAAAIDVLEGKEPSEAATAPAKARAPQTTPEEPEQVEEPEEGEPDETEEGDEE
ncbi:MAG: 50S ribosomal protein L4 [Actinomycetota bacterium]|nr:50S ribosomal protein L4 [Actinomycetota bacterium]